MGVASPAYFPIMIRVSLALPAVVVAFIHM